MDYSNISQTGQYILKFGSEEDGNAFNLNFTIVPEVTGLLVKYTMPDGFTVTDATIDGETAEYTESSVPMEKEGLYSISYVCAVSQQTYSLQTTVDHTAPVLALAAVKNGKASGPVSLEDAEKGAVLTITRNGDSVKAKSVLTDPGTYTVKITDTAGNSNDYQFVITTYLNVNSFVFFGLLLAAIGGLAAYYWYAKTHLRIR